MKERQYFRVGFISKCLIQLRQLGNKTLSPGEVFEVEVQDLSGGGLCFLSDRELAVNDMLTWKFSIQIQNETIEVLGQIVWKKTGDKMNSYGVRFILIDEAQRRDLIQKVQLLQIRQRQKQNQNHMIGF